jgi:hypothetical protein
MPRNPEVAARSRLEAAVASRGKARKALLLLDAKVREAQIAAVEAGVPRWEVAELSGIDRTQISKIPGMPKGRGGPIAVRHNGNPAR